MKENRSGSATYPNAGFEVMEFGEKKPRLDLAQIMSSGQVWETFRVLGSGPDPQERPRHPL